MLVLAVFLIFIGNGFTASRQDQMTESAPGSDGRSVLFPAVNYDREFFNPLAIP